MDIVVLDTETTGLDPQRGHRIIEIGCVLLQNRKHTNEKFHCYLNPQREIDHEAKEIHGITEEFLSDKPLFQDIREDFIKFLEDKEVVIHNAPFDVGFLNNELHICKDARRIENLCDVIDTLQISREMHPGQRNSLDALCRRYSIDNSSRTLHGALLDAEILADVYLAMTGGQTTLELETSQSEFISHQNKMSSANPKKGNYSVIMATDQENAQHQRWLDLLGKDSPWHNDNTDD